MASVSYRSLAADILEKVGGEENIMGATHCATRLRLKLRDESKADTAAVENLPGVLTVMQAGGQYQVVIGNEVPTVFAELGKISRFGKDDTNEEAPAQGNLFNRFIDVVSSIFSPILWPLAGAGLFKAFLSMATTFGWVDATNQTYVILSAAADALFYFLPLFLAITAARRFKTNQFTSMAIAGTLVYPSIVALGTAGEPVAFAGIPLVMMNYTSSVIPIIVAVWLQGYLERFLLKVLPAAIRNFMTPLLSIVLMVPLTLLTVGPLTTFASQGISGGITAIFTFAPWLAGAIMGGLWQVFVLFGLHWGFVPIMANELATGGQSLLMAPLVPAVLAQAAAMLAVALRSRSAKRREVAAPAALSGFLAGVTEPGIYGVNLPLKKPFYFGIAAGAIGGAVAAIGGSASNAFVFPSLLSLPAFASVGSFALLLTGTGLAVAIAFTLTFLFGPREQADAAAIPSVNDPVPAPDAEPSVGQTAGVTARNIQVLAPVSGAAVALSDVPDRVFSSGAMGAGMGIIPEDGKIYAPVSGIIQAAMKTGHAYGIKSDDGVEVLVHIGIDTVQMKGEGFESAVIRGQRVEAGDLLATIDRGKIEAAGYDSTTIMVVTNTKELTAVLPSAEGRLAHGVPALDVEL
ncbi:PTS system beta-glucoside-specific IIA component, Glc family /PTS system beta-glucoside-specific IIB component, Glc family /PTS system beta-glucoside-specific IIC component, Glc family [Arthrobacter subterraneus]|uniref:PTS system beta-glucoside-specific IIA component, Glc family /PTS system beta-glucoside-specific IIB component, Glc family /PTS system beta-glucoside-specific IIC component, Glc family n=1 Tax=Arthrobacter subterraneus TaxID=335973 RepID=A0A1G8N702_9MICC|nr:beta-glucoside-specific PTS transporter subunit IIABC [Arthrobacter subterraneus]SDI75817.1 PTS system beta-glucoside-specific IIA component, Glc family /PTS system beta-glucoside-specific IIB component, Glc family /PTS system beta-glucoside-specific IIC component, Glc family [Arthrobacter subterraneus]